VAIDAAQAPTSNATETPPEPLDWDLVENDREERQSEFHQKKHASVLHTVEWPLPIPVRFGIRQFRPGRGA
jgi:hypothetical protein